MEESPILIKLLCAHLLSDFVLQTDSLNKGKRAGGKTGLCCQLVHSGIHAVVAYLLVAQWDNWLLPLAILLTHFAIDFVKCRYAKDTTTTFIADQLCHIAVLLLLWHSMWHEQGCACTLAARMASPKTWCVLAAYLAVLKPSSVLLSLFLNKWAPTTSAPQSLPNAGQWIGYIERTLTLTFILVDNIECVGFLLTAKSVFRFGELSKATEIKATEYVLIGTLSSFAIAIIMGFGVSHAIS